MLKSKNLIVIFTALFIAYSRSFGAYGTITPDALHARTIRCWC
jgi:hypothetical protein